MEDVQQEVRLAGGAEQLAEPQLAVQLLQLLQDSWRRPPTRPRRVQGDQLPMQTRTAGVSVAGQMTPCEATPLLLVW